jgi:Caspase domain
MKKYLLLLFSYLMLGCAFAQSKLPRCEGNYYKNTWSNCFGVKEGVRGEIYVGEFLNNIRSGQGIQYNAKGEVLYSGIWKNNNFETHMLLDAQQFAFQYSNQAAIISNIEIEKLRAEAEDAKRKQAEAEEQLRLAQQKTQAITSIASTPSIGRRVALVVGNSNYKVRPLKNPRNDADDISKTLRSSGFEVIDLRDATLQQMRTGVRQFGDRLINNDAGLVYYSGHGVEVKGRNYFIPVNADIQREDEIADQGLDVSLILEKMNTAGKGVNILIVDACRDDPFGRSFRSTSRGLAQMDAPRGTIIAYATSPGKVAADGDGRNSPYTKNLVKAMQQPNKPIEQVFKEVRRAVQEETKNQQTPWENTSLSGDFYFRVQR